MTLTITFRQLTKKGTDGVTYYRRVEVEQQIKEIEAMDLHSPELQILKERIAVRKESMNRSLKSETLVALFRELRDHDIACDISDALSFRVLQVLNSYHHTLGNEDYFAQFADEVFLKLLEGIMDDSDRADYAQASFGQYVLGIASNAARKWYDRLAHDRKTDIIDAHRHGDESLPVFQIKAPGLNPEELLALKERIRQIPQPNRDAWILHRVYGYQIQSNDPNEPTVDKHFGKTERTIRSWIRKADEILAEGGRL